MRLTANDRTMIVTLKQRAAEMTPLAEDEEAEKRGVPVDAPIENVMKSAAQVRDHTMVTEDGHVILFTHGFTKESKLVWHLSVSHILLALGGALVPRDRVAEVAQAFGFTKPLAEYHVYDGKTAVHVVGPVETN